MNASRLAYVNAIGSAVPAHDIHHPFVAFGRSLLRDVKSRLLFERMAERSGISRRFSHFLPGRMEAGEIDAGGFYKRGAFPPTSARMARYEALAPDLAIRSVANLDCDLDAITHLVVASCTGFSAPSLDWQIAMALGLRNDVERTLIGFMGCSAAIPALRAAAAIVGNEPDARVLVVNCELCTLHMKETSELETVLSFLLWGDGATAALVTAQPLGIELVDFRAAMIPDSADFLTWRIGEQGFDMHLSGRVPGRIAAVLRDELGRNDDAGLLRGAGVSAVEHWAVHAGGRSVLDAVEVGLQLERGALATSRSVLHDFGNMSSATIMFVLQRLLAAPARAGARGLAMAFGPGLVAETFRFRLA